MRNTKAILLLICCLALPAAAQSTPLGDAGSSAVAAPEAKTIDGIAARIENDVLTDSQVQELQHYQQLVDGQVQDRAAVIEDLVDQWIVRSEAVTTKFPRPTPEQVAAEFQTLVRQFPSPAQFQKRVADAGLTKREVRELIERQLYYTTFLNYKFHAAARVTASQIEQYYHQQLAPTLEKRRVSVPPLDQVEAQIRQLLTQEAINVKASQWLQETKRRLKIVIQPGESGG